MHCNPEKRCRMAISHLINHIYAKNAQEIARILLFLQLKNEWKRTSKSHPHLTCQTNLILIEIEIVDAVGI